MKQTITTLNWHINKPCNMGCHFCYATFADLHQKNLGLTKSKEIISILAESKQFNKINFAGGEPTLVKYLPELVQYAKSLGLSTSIITNGTMIDKEYLSKMQGSLDLIGLSIDSINESTNIKIGRTVNDVPLKEYEYLEKAELVHNAKIKLKINTVVNKFNKEETLVNFINQTETIRWKILQASKVEGQNDAHIQALEITKFQFDSYVKRNQTTLKANCNLIQEPTDVLLGSYIMLNPNGELFESSQGVHTYSQNILEVAIATALAQINPSYSNFKKRDGDYKI